MVQFDVPFSFLIGGSLALAARRQLKDHASTLGSRPFTVAVLYTALLFVPSVVYFYFRWPDWEWMYFLDGARLNPLFLSLFVCTCFLAMIGGFALVHSWIKRGKLRHASATCLVVAVGLALFLLLTRDRALHLGTYAEYHAGQAVLMWQTPLLPALVVAGVIDLVPLAYLFLRFSRGGKVPAPGA